MAPRIEENPRVHLKNVFAEVSLGNFLLTKTDNVKGK